MIQIRLRDIFVCLDRDLAGAHVTPETSEQYQSLCRKLHGDPILLVAFRRIDDQQRFTRIKIAGSTLSILLLASLPRKIPAV